MQLCGMPARRVCVQVTREEAAVRAAARALDLQPRVTLPFVTQYGEPLRCTAAARPARLVQSIRAG